MFKKKKHKNRLMMYVIPLAAFMLGKVMKRK